MAGTAYQLYSKRTVSKRSAGRYDATEVWCVPKITNTNSVETDTLKDSWQFEALGATGLPKIGDNAGTEGNLICMSLTPRSVDNQGTAFIDVHFQEDPLTLPTEVHYFSATKNKPAWRGLYSDCSDGSPAIPPALKMNDNLDIRNTAGDRFNPPVTYPAGLARIEVVTRMSLIAHDEITWQNYLDHWNADAYQIDSDDPDNEDNGSGLEFPAGCLWMVDKRAIEVKDPYLHRLVTCVFLYDPDTVGTRVANIGPRCRQHIALQTSGTGAGTLILVPQPGNTDGMAIGPVTDCRGLPFGGLAELDENGDQLLPTSPGPPIVFPPALVFAWFPVGDDNKTYSCDFDDLDLFSPERTMEL